MRLPDENPSLKVSVDDVLEATRRLRVGTSYTLGFLKQVFCVRSFQNKVKML